MVVLGKRMGCEKEVFAAGKKDGAVVMTYGERKWECWKRDRAVRGNYGVVRREDWMLGGRMGMLGERMGCEEEGWGRSERGWDVRRKDGDVGRGDVV